MQAPSVIASRQDAPASDLARLCLPQEYKDSNRNLAWANSICFLFLLVGIVGLKAPQVVRRPLTQPVDIVPVVFTPPEEQPKPQESAKQEETEQPQNSVVDTPQIVTAVTADSAGVAFAVPVEGPVTLVPARFAPPPPAVTTAPPRPTTFVPGQGEGGTFPWPRAYPKEALDQRAEGTVMLYAVVDPDGTPSKVEVKDTSGHFVLDRFASQWVKNNWRWLPGVTRYYLVPFQFKLQ